MIQQLWILHRKTLDKEIKNWKGNPQERSGVLNILPKGQGFVNTTFKNKQTQTGQIANRDGHISKNMGGEAALPTNPEKFRADKRKINM